MLKRSCRFEFLLQVLVFDREKFCEGSEDASFGVRRACIKVVDRIRFTVYTCGNQNMSTGQCEIFKVLIYHLITVWIHKFCNRSNQSCYVFYF